MAVYWSLSLYMIHATESVKGRHILTQKRNITQLKIYCVDRNKMGALLQAQMVAKKSQ
jgi:hypothetical protein